MRLGKVFAAALALFFCQAAHAASAEQTLTRALERLSFTLRARRLSATELTSIQKEAKHTSPRTLYEAYVDRWLTPDAVATVAESVFAGGVDDASNLFLKLEVSGTGDRAVFRLPKAAGAPPCAENDVVEVTPWWAPEHKVRICKDSYLPERSFDKVGYCAGQAEPTIQSPPRAGCACGPLLLACIPSSAADPALMKQLGRGVDAEMQETVRDIVAHHRSANELLTTSKTWQTGLVQFLYLRRALIAELSKNPYSPALEAQLLSRIKAVDLTAPGHWVERTGVYAKSGLYTNTLMVQTTMPTYRVIVKSLFANFLCHEFKGINVDSHVLLGAVGGMHAQLRALGSVRSSPMIHTEGCKGCHAPMDNTAAFLEGLATPLYGFMPTGLAGESKMFLKGATDFRGEGVGQAALGQLVVEQPEFGKCVVSSTLRKLIGENALLPAQEAEANRITNGFNERHRDLAWAIRSALLSEAYSGIPATEERFAAAPPLEGPPLETMVSEHCVKCHNGDVSFDLRQLPAQNDTKTWALILHMVEDSRMPPPKENGTIRERFPLDPEVRNAFIAQVEQRLDARAEVVRRPSHLLLSDWLSIVRDVAQRALPAAKAEPLLRPFVGLSMSQVLPPDYLMEARRISSDVCSAITEEESLRPVAARKLLPTLPWPTSSASAARWRVAAVTRLHKTIFDTAPSAAQLQYETGQLEELFRSTADWSESWTTLCATFLSSPRLLYLYDR